MCIRDRVSTQSTWGIYIEISAAQPRDLDSIPAQIAPPGMTSYNRVMVSLNKWALKWRFGSQELNHPNLRIPFNPKVVVYSPYRPLYNVLISRTFNNYNQLNAQNQNQIKGQVAEGVNPEENQIRWTAEQILKYDDNLNNRYLLSDYPNTLAQAKRLDELIDGFNLVLNLDLTGDVQNALQTKGLKCLTCGREFNLAVPAFSPEGAGVGTRCAEYGNCNIVPQEQDIKSQVQDYRGRYAEVLKHYENTGALINFSVRTNESFAEAQRRLEGEVLANFKDQA
eukprot:TRINITY_DN2968_c0_g4_i1.p2 TRINITY_DN2968_c0_g4~~TRINITY_DN2968_c0_g4_i1.p2  ORF type:complete len:281 (-),score=87.24 TRINITY_DN2968_c0_g4_i1:252-1094(-)